MGIDPPRPCYVRSTLLDGIWLYLGFSQSFVDELKAAIPPGSRSYDGDEKRWFVARNYEGEALRLARRYFLGLREHRATEARGPFGGRSWFDWEQERQRRIGDQRRNTQAPPPPPTFGGRASTDAAALFVTEDAPPEVVRAAYKALAIIYHPDRGGDTAKMQSLNAAYARLKKAGKA